MEYWIHTPETPSAISSWNTVRALAPEIQELTATVTSHFPTIHATVTDEGIHYAAWEHK